MGRERLDWVAGGRVGVVSGEFGGRNSGGHSRGWELRGG